VVSKASWTAPFAHTSEATAIGSLIDGDVFYTAGSERVIK